MYYLLTLDEKMCCEVVICNYKDQAEHLKKVIGTDFKKVEIIGNEQMRGGECLSYIDNEFSPDAETHSSMIYEVKCQELKIDTIFDTQQKRIFKKEKWND